MSKFFMVKVTKVTMALVEVEDGEDASDAETVALDENIGAEVEIDSGPFLPGSTEYDRAARHADEKYRL